MMRAVGVYAGIGAMLLAFKEQGWHIVCNYEDRSIHTYRDTEGRNTFEENFNAPMKLPNDVGEVARGEVELVASQPKCGGFSNLYGTGRKSTDTTTSRSEYGKGILSSIYMIESLQPKYFYLENLPKSLTIVSAEQWHSLLPDYNLQFEYVSNYHYGNPQKGRNRMYVIGCHKDLDFIFVPQEVRNGGTVKGRIGDLVGREGEVPNHEFHSSTDTDNITNLAKGNKWRDIAVFNLGLEPGENIPYRAQDGNIKRRIGSNKLKWDQHSHTLAGVKGLKIHPLTGYPISIRERCRLQGYPDSFIIYGTRFNDDGTWTLSKNSNIVRQLNNTVPYEFTEEFAEQLCYYEETGDLLHETPVRGIKPNPLIEKARKAR